MRNLRTIWRGGMLLGEGPVWDVGRGQLWFVDIKQSRVHRLDPGFGHVDSWTAPDLVGWVLPAQDGTLVAGLRRGLARFDPAAGSFTSFLGLEADVPGNRLNDATVAPDGAIWLGSMDDAEASPSGRVYRFDGRTAEPLPIRPTVITNGPAFAPDGRTVYHVDTLGGLIHAFHVGTDGTLGAGHLFARIPASDGHPDGVTVDSQGNLWVGMWQGWCARLYSPDGALIDEVAVPAANVTKVALGGADMRTAYVTTARTGLDADELAFQPDAGALFAFDVEVPGQVLPAVRLG